MSLKVMTYNILDGGENREQYLLQVIQAARPDVVILQEVFSEEFLKSLAHALGMAYYFGTGNKQRKVALLSRLPISRPKSYHPLFPIWRNFLNTQIEYEPKKFIRIIGVHLMANLWVAGEIWRWWEAMHIIKHIRGYQNEPCLVAGDFNAIAPTDNIEINSMPKWLKLIIFSHGNIVYRFSIQIFLSSGLTDCFRAINSKTDGFTWPPPNPYARLDYIFANARATMYLKNCWVVREPEAVNQASDHYPVMAEFSFTSQCIKARSQPTVRGTDGATAA